MARELVSRNLWDFPMLRLSSLLDDETDLLPTPFSESSSNGLSISEDDKNIYVEAALPGVNPDDIEITYDQGMLRIRGQATQSEEDKDKKYYRQASSSFAYRVAVPGQVDPNQDPQATCNDGLLKLTFTKASKPEPKKIAINSGSSKDTDKAKSEK